MIEVFDLSYFEKEMDSLNNKCDNIINKYREDPGNLAIDILKELRKLVDSMACYAMYKCGKTYPNMKKYDITTRAINYCNGKHSTLKKLCDNLNASQHEDFDNEYAVRLMEKYVPMLIECRNDFMKSYNKEILSNLDRYPLTMDDTFYDYYCNIVPLMRKFKPNNTQNNGTRYYIHKKKPIYVKGYLFYEYTLTTANDNYSKFDRFVAFSNINIYDKYAVKASFHIANVEMFGRDVEIYVMTKCNVSIRPCEINSMGRIFGLDLGIKRTVEFQKMMKYIENNSISLDKILKFESENYDDFCNYVFSNGIYSKLHKFCDTARNYLKTKTRNLYTVKYLLNMMNNQITKSQYDPNNKQKDGLFLSNKCFLFEKMPFAFNLKQHIPALLDLLDCFDYNFHKNELVKRIVIEKEKQCQQLYISKSEFQIPDFEERLRKCNDKVRKYNQDYVINEFNNNVYYKEYEDTLYYVLLKIKELYQNASFTNYSNYAKGKIDELGLVFDDDSKKNTVIQMFEKTNIFAVYGAAGSGKTYLANQVINVFNTTSVLCLTNTHSALSNLKSKIQNKSLKFNTIKKYNSNSDFTIYDLVIIDECSTISNSNIATFLKKCRFKTILFLGDTNQIEAIDFGNWFKVLKKYLPKYCMTELTGIYRCNEFNLKELWKKVRKNDVDIQEFLATCKISHGFSDEIYEKCYNDEIILCLNYDGIYGINNINRVLQKNNSNKEVRWKQYVFKKDDPILFLENHRFEPKLYNNLKGIIVDIINEPEYLKFKVKVDITLTSFFDEHPEYDIIETLEDGKTIIEFSVFKYNDDYFDNDTSERYQIPFQLAYAISIHKAQGLEYDSVKVIIANDVEEIIDYNIFYTAITRAKKCLNIYWSEKTENLIINNLTNKNEISATNDLNKLKARYKDL